MRTAIAVRRKVNPTAHFETALPESVDLNAYDVFDEHGNPASEDQLQAIRDLQNPNPQVPQPIQGKVKP